MARYPAAFAAFIALFLALFFPYIANAQVVAPVAPVAEPAAPVPAPANPAPAPANPAPAPANPAPAPANPAPAPANPAPAPANPAPAAPAPPAGGGGIGGVGGVGVGGAAGVPVLAPTQYPVVLKVPKIITVPGTDGKPKTTSTDIMFTQTFKTGALETWHFSTPKQGVIGLGGLEAGNRAPEITGK